MKYLSKIIYILIFLVMVTSPYAGHTYAEYARQSTGEDSARVSRFGITTTATCNAFLVSYMGTGEYADETTVASTDGAKVFAPGTSGILCEYHITGTPEVRTLVTKTATVTMNDQWTNDEGDFYCPLSFTIGETTVNGLNYTSSAALIAALEAEMERGNGAYGTNYDFANASTSAVHNRVVYWHWPLEGAHGSEITQTMENDNALGNKAVKPTFAVSFELTVEQVD